MLPWCSQLFTRFPALLWQLFPWFPALLWLVISPLHGPFVAKWIPQIPSAGVPVTARFRHPRQATFSQWRFRPRPRPKSWRTDDVAMETRVTSHTSSYMHFCLHTYMHPHPQTHWFTPLLVLRPTDPASPASPGCSSLTGGLAIEGDVFR